MKTENRIEGLRLEIEELKKRWPAHSIPPALMEQLDELESQLALELEKLRREKMESKEKFENGGR